MIGSKIELDIDSKVMGSILRYSFPTVRTWLTVLTHKPPQQSPGCWGLELKADAPVVLEIPLHLRC